MKKKVPIPDKPVTRGRAEKALLWILKNSARRGTRVSFESVDWNRPLDPLYRVLYSTLGTEGATQAVNPIEFQVQPLEITIKLKILEKGVHYFD